MLKSRHTATTNARRQPFNDRQKQHGNGNNKSAHKLPMQLRRAGVPSRHRDGKGPTTAPHKSWSFSASLGTKESDGWPAGIAEDEEAEPAVKAGCEEVAAGVDP